MGRSTEVAEDGLGWTSWGRRALCAEKFGERGRVQGLYRIRGKVTPWEGLGEDRLRAIESVTDEVIMVPFTTGFG